MWESDLFSTLKDRLIDYVKAVPRPAGGFLDETSRLWNKIVERTLAAPGTEIWGEMKQNADAISANQGPADGDRSDEERARRMSGLLLLYDIGRRSDGGPPPFDPARVRLHFIGHSAGAIVDSLIIQRLAGAGWRFSSVNFMAPAVRVDVFDQTVTPILGTAVERYHQFHLTDDLEQQDHTCRPVVGYGRSLLYLVSESFEGGARTPLLGMQKYFQEWLGRLPAEKQACVRSWEARETPYCRATTHGGFDDDDATMAAVVSLVKGRM